MAETGKRIKSLLNEDVRPVVAQIAECLADWYKHAQTIYVKVGLTVDFIFEQMVTHLHRFVDSVSGEGLKKL